MSSGDESEFLEEEDIQLEQLNDENENENQEEEEVQHEIVVVDDELIQSLQQSIKAKNPIILSQSVDVMLGCAGFLKHIIFEEEHELNPIEMILPTLISTLMSISENQQSSSKKKEGSKNLLQKVSKCLLNFDLFKKNMTQFCIFCDTFSLLTKFMNNHWIKKALTLMINFAFSQNLYHEKMFQVLSSFKEDELFITAVKIVHFEFLRSVENCYDESISTLLDPYIDCFLQNFLIFKPHFESIIVRISKSLSELISDQKSLFTWSFLGNICFSARVIEKIETNEKFQPNDYRTDIVTLLVIILRNFNIHRNLLFQLKVATLLYRISQNYYSPLLYWIIDVFEFLVNSKMKGNDKINFQTSFEMPSQLSLNFCDNIFEVSSKLFNKVVFPQTSTIYFPEFIQPIILRLNVVFDKSKNKQFANKLLPLIKILTSQQSTILLIRNSINWTSRSEQLENFQKIISERILPIRSSLEAQQKLKEIANTETDDRLEVITYENP